MRTFVLLLPVVLVVLCVSVFRADTILVPSQQSTIQAGIDAAVNGDTVLVADGTYTGDGNRDIDFLGKAIVVMSENGAESCVIDCEGYGRGFYFHSGEDLSTVVQGFTITNGWANSTGGGMLIEYSSPTVTNCTFSGNYAPYCGGMKNDHSSPTVTNCTFSGNSGGTGGMDNSSSHPTVINCLFSENVGRGMYNLLSDPMVTNCTFSGNATVSNGGGISNFNSDPTFTNCTFSGNSAGLGGGMYNRNFSNPTMINCTFSENSADTSGGGMYNNDDCSSLTATNCTFIGNEAVVNGGGMSNYHNSIPTLTDCAFIGNLAGNDGGGIFNRVSHPTFTKCAFTGNTAGVDGGGVYNYDRCHPTFTNCTFSGNTANVDGGGVCNYNGSYPLISNCIIWGDLPDEIYDYDSNPMVSYSDVQGGYPGTGNIDEDPMFVQPDTLLYTDYRLLWGSPCIDAGNPNLHDPDGTRNDMGTHYFNQDDFLTLYLTPDVIEILPGDVFGVTYTAINRWDNPEDCWLLSQVRRSDGAWFNLIGPKQYTLPANFTVQVHITHPTPHSTPPSMYEYRSLIGVPPGTLYDSDSFTFKVIE